MVSLPKREGGCPSMAGVGPKSPNATWHIAPSNLVANLTASSSKSRANDAACFACISYKLCWAVFCLNFSVSLSRCCSCCSCSLVAAIAPTLKARYKQWSITRRNVTLDPDTTEAISNPFHTTTMADRDIAASLIKKAFLPLP